MIKRLRLKFILVTMGAMVIVFSMVFFTLNIFMQRSSARQTEELLEMVAEHNELAPPWRGEPPRRNASMPGRRMPDVEMVKAGRFFYVKVDSSGKYFETNFELMFDFSKEEAWGYADMVLKKGNEKGTIEHLQYLVADKAYGKIIVFAGRSVETLILSQLIYTSLWVAGGAFLILLVFSFLLSGWAVKPVKIAFEKQRQFISDASHELKTPLTIISANADILENEISRNKRLVHIKSQTERMSGLINNLLALAKSDEGNSKIIMNQFDLSGAVLNATLEFESRIFEEGKNLDYNIEENIFYTGDELQLKQLTAILIDNAVKHSDKAGMIKVALEKSSDKPVLSVFNTGSGIDDSQKEKIFDRFYRSDESRSRDTGGYGLGLSIAKSIIETHKGKIIISGKAGEGVKFSVFL